MHDYRVLVMKTFCIGAVLSVITLVGCSVAATSTPTAPTTGAPSTLPTTAPVALAPSTSATIAANPTLSQQPTSTLIHPTTGAKSDPSALTNQAPAPARVVNPAGQINLPPGFGISVFARGLATPRNIVIGPDGQLYVAERGAGRIVRLPDRNHDGLSDGIEVVASGFDRPSSLAFNKDGSLYVSTPTQVFRLSQADSNGVFQKQDLVVDGLPGPTDHFTRTLLFSPDGSYLFVQVGSSCNACNESDPRRAAILRFRADGSGGEIYARGLRNAVGITFRPGTNELWAANNGSDYLGQDQPPDTVEIVQQGQDYGWPRCEAGNVINPQFGGPGACNSVAQPLIDIQAHSAALGLTFYTGNQFPSDYRGDLFIALHGSIYRNVPTGYKVVRVHFNNGTPGPVQDFATGWLAGGREWGRPTDVVTAPDGSLFVSDDSGGIIYRIFHSGQ